METLITKHRTLWSDKFFVTSVIIGLILFAGSLFVNYRAITYAFRVEGVASTDILLDNLPVINTDIVFSEGALVFIIFVLLLLISKPKTIPFTLKSLALFILIRSAFVIMTHLGPSPDSIVTDLSHLGYISSGADLFFSGHTGMPFLMALLFWQDKTLRWVFLFCSLAAAIAVILGHLHYTIDVFSAFFITYGIWHLAQKFFPKDYKLFKSGLPTNNNLV